MHCCAVVVGTTGPEVVVEAGGPTVDVVVAPVVVTVGLNGVWVLTSGPTVVVVPGTDGVVSEPAVVVDSTGEVVVSSLPAVVVLPAGTVVAAVVVPGIAVVVVMTPGRTVVS